MGRKVAVVTGANRGLGLSVVRCLCKDFPGDVILTGRNAESGFYAVQSLKAEGFSPIWHELDVTQPASAYMLRNFIKEKYGGIDILVNNAGASFPKASQVTLARQAELMVNTNLKGSILLYKIFYPLLRPGARIVILSNNMVTLGNLGDDLRLRFDLDRMSLYDLEKLGEEYVTAVKSDAWDQFGWPDKILATVGVLQSCLAMIIARDLKDDNRRNILVNAGCPGVMATDAMKTYLDNNGCLGDVKAVDAETAAPDIAWLALLPSGAQSPNGEVVMRRKCVKFMDDRAHLAKNYKPVVNKSTGSTLTLQ